jgi:uncharacterized repeat protein (TIGR01451 family)
MWIICNDTTQSFFYPSQTPPPKTTSRRANYSNSSFLIKFKSWRPAMTKDTSYEFLNPRDSRTKRIGASALALTLFVSQVTPAFATIDNSAIVSGTYGASTTTYGPSTATVNVAPAVGTLTITKAAGSPTIAAGDATITDVGDTILYTYTVKNTGNVTLTAVTPVDAGPTFNGFAGTGSLGTFAPASVTLAPGITQIFTATYTLSNVDAYHGAGVSAGVANSANATGKTPALVTVNTTVPGTATTTIVAGPKLSVSKVAVLDDTNGTVATKAEVGEYIDYTYTVANIGNVAMTNIKITDTHEGAALPAGTVKNETLTVVGPIPGSVDELIPVNNGTWVTLQPGATVRFTYHHLVTQAEVDGG